MSKPFVREKVYKFFSQFKPLTYQKGEVLLRAEDPPQGVFYVKNGYVRLYTLSEDGRELTLNIFKPGSYFSMMWALGDIPNSYHFEAMTEVKVLRAPKETVNDFIKNNPDVLFELTSRILIGLNGLLNNIEYITSRNASKRVISSLLILAKRFGEKTKSNGLLINFQLTHQDIANITNLARETVSIEMKKIEDKGIIEYEGRQLMVKNIANLENELITQKEENSSPHVV